MHATLLDARDVRQLELISGAIRISKNPAVSGGVCIGGSEAGEVRPQLQPVVEPQVSHFMQVPLRTSVKLPHSLHISPS